MFSLFEYSQDTESYLTQKNVRVIAGMLSALICLISVFFTRNIDFLIGLAIGSAVSQLLFRQHELSIESILSTGNAGKGTVDYIIRLAIRAAVIYAAARRGMVCAAGSVLGLLSIPYSIYLLAFIENRIIRKSGEKEGKSN